MTFGDQHQLKVLSLNHPLVKPLFPMGTFFFKTQILIGCVIISNNYLDINIYVTTKLVRSCSV